MYKHQLFHVFNLKIWDIHGIFFSHSHNFCIHLRVGYRYSPNPTHVVYHIYIHNIIY